MKKGIKMKILLAPNDIGGHLWGLHIGLRQHNIDSNVLYYHSSRFNFPASTITDLEMYPKFIQRGIKFLKFPRLYRNYDIFHYNNGMSLLPQFFDLKFLKNRKKIFVTFNGTSSRLKKYALKHYRYSQFSINGELINNTPEYISEDEKVRRIKIWEKYADKIFCLNPDLCRTCQNSIFLPYIKPAFYKLKTEGIYNVGKKIRIGHCPTNRIVKGTKYFQQAVDKLSVRYNNFEVVYIENVDNMTATSIMRSCDIILDQLLVGWYGGVAVEAMKLGKPVIAYIRESDLVYIPKSMRRELPIINANPDTILSVLENILENPSTLSEISIKSLDYVNKYHDPFKIAKKVLEIYDYN